MSNGQPLWAFVLCVSKGEGKIWPFWQKARHISGHLFTLAQCLCVSPCSESHPLLRLSVYMAVYCGLAREKQRKTAVQMKQKQQITQSITQWQCAYLKCCQHVCEAESKMLKWTFIVQLHQVFHIIQNIASTGSCLLWNSQNISSLFW